MIVVIFAFQCSQRYCEHCFLRFNACSVTASTVFCVSAFAALLRALFFAFQRLQRYCEHCFLRFGVCSVTASIVFCVLSLAALLRALKFLFSSLRNGGTCWNGRGGACVPARTSTQWRFHTKMRYCHPQTLHFHPRMMHFHVQTRCFYPRKAPLTMDAPLRGALAGTQARPLPLLQRNYSFSFLILIVGYRANTEAIGSSSTCLRIDGRLFEKQKITIVSFVFGNSRPIPAITAYIGKRAIC